MSAAVKSPAESPARPDTAAWDSVASAPGSSESFVSNEKFGSPCKSPKFDSVDGRVVSKGGSDVSIGGSDGIVESIGGNDESILGMVVSIAGRDLSIGGREVSKLWKVSSRSIWPESAAGASCDSAPGLGGSLDGFAGSVVSAICDLSIFSDSGSCKGKIPRGPYGLDCRYTPSSTARLLGKNSYTANANILRCR